MARDGEKWLGFFWFYSVAAYIGNWVCMGLVETGAWVLYFGALYSISRRAQAWVWWGSSGQQR